MNELLLVVTIAGERVALPAAAVEAVVELDTLIPVPRARRTSPVFPRCAAAC